MNIRSKIFGGEKPVEPSPVVAAKKPKGARTDALLSVPVEREEFRRSDTRGSDRHRLPDEQVRVTHKGQTHAVQLVNLSGGGAMVAGDFAPLLWDRVELHLGDDGVIECAVRWLRGDRIGLEFAHETQLDCSPDEQAVLLREVIANSFLDVEFGAPQRPEGNEESTAEHRGERRHPLIWSGVLHYDFHSAPVRLRNISSTGALVDCHSPLPVGAEPLLDLGEAGSIFATVTWVVGDEAGLRFHAPFDLTMLARAKPQIAPVKWERPSYLNAGAAADSPWAAQWDRMSLSELKDELDGYMKR